MPIHLTLADDCPVIVAGLQAMLEPFNHRVRVQHTPAGHGADPQPDVVLYDPATTQHRAPLALLSPRNGLKARGPKLVVFSWDDDPDRVQAAHAVGADAQISKTLTAEALTTAIERIHRGEQIGLRTTGPASSALDTWPGAEHNLSGRESEILTYICQGLSNQQISERAYVSINTVKTYIRSTYRKIGATNRPNAVIWGLSHGFAPAQDIRDLDPSDLT